MGNRAFARGRGLVLLLALATAACGSEPDKAPPPAEPPAEIYRIEPGAGTPEGPPSSFSTSVEESKRRKKLIRDLDNVKSSF